MSALTKVIQLEVGQQGDFFRLEKSFVRGDQGQMIHQGRSPQESIYRVLVG